jgi:hypothetical protein
VADDLAVVDVQDLASDVGRRLKEQDVVYYVADLLHRVSAIDMPGFVANGDEHFHDELPWPAS